LALLDKFLLGSLLCLQEHPIRLFEDIISLHI